MGKANADGDGVFILELEGGGRFVQLVGTDTPRRGVQVAAELRAVTTHYPGSSKPSTQILGTKDEEIPFEGTFRDDLYGLDGHAVAQMAELTALMKGQRYAELNWGQALVKRGYVGRVEHTVHAEGWIDYRFTFRVHESDEPIVVETPFAPVAVPFDLLALLREIAASAAEVAEAAALINNVVRAVA